MSPAPDNTTDRPISTLPDGLWSQPAVDTSAIDVLADTEKVASIRTPAALTYSYTPGTARSNFLRGMAEKRLMGERDPESDTVYTPPTGVIPTNGLAAAEQVELAHVGTVTSYCVVNVQFSGGDHELPYVTALVLPDGSSVPLYGLIQEVPFDQIHSGMRVEAVWVDDDDLATSFENIKWWRPNGEEDADPSSYAQHV